MIAFASSLDTAGVIAQTAEDCALVLSQMIGFDKRDSTSIELPPEDLTIGLNDGVKGCVSVCLALGLIKLLRPLETPSMPH